MSGGHTHNYATGSGAPVAGQVCVLISSSLHAPSFIRLLWKAAKALQGEQINTPKAKRLTFTARLANCNTS